MIERGRHPAVHSVAGFAIGRELGRQVGRIGGLVVIRLMAAETGVRRRSVIAVMANIAIITYTGMSTLQRPVVIMDREGGRLPSGIGSVACLTGDRNSNPGVVWIG